MNLSDLERMVEGFGHPRVLIVGDLILDQYVSGEVARISPEAPIPVLTARRTEERLGGACNVAANLVAMQAEVDIVGVLGNDGWGRKLRALLEEQKVDTGGCVLDPSRPTIQKTRMMSGSQQMLRVDNEDPSSIRGEALAAVLKILPERVRRAQAVVLSDYGKGLLTSEVIRCAIDAARAAGVPVLVDPKGEDYRRYRGATLVTPNRKEAEQALGHKLPRLEDVQRGAQELMQLADLDSAVITLGAEGIYYANKQGLTGHVPARARAVFDVTGAGDTVIAQLGFYFAAGVELSTAVFLANQAAALVVARLGTHAVDRSELRAALEEKHAHEGKVLRTSAELDRQLAAWRKDGKRIAFTNGVFDVLHVGHVSYLRFAKSYGDVLIVGVNDDASVKRLKGPTRPVNPLGDRMEVLAALEMVDAVCSFSEDTPKSVIERVSPNVLIKGADWAEKGVVGREWVEAHGGQVVLAPLVAGKSTTSILERAKKNG